MSKLKRYVYREGMVIFLSGHTLVPEEDPDRGRSTVTVRFLTRISTPEVLVPLTMLGATSTMLRLTVTGRRIAPVAEGGALALWGVLNNSMLVQVDLKDVKQFRHYHTYRGDTASADVDKLLSAGQSCHPMVEPLTTALKGATGEAQALVDYAARVIGGDYPVRSPEYRFMDKLARTTIGYVDWEFDDLSP